MDELRLKGIVWSNMTHWRVASPPKLQVQITTAGKAKSVCKAVCRLNPPQESSSGEFIPFSGFEQQTSITTAIFSHSDNSLCNGYITDFDPAGGSFHSCVGYSPHCVGSESALREVLSFYHLADRVFHITFCVFCHNGWFSLASAG